MRLKSVLVENHSRLADTSIEVRDHLVLVGPNDVGKSALIRCLDLLLGASTPQLYSRITPADIRDVELPLVIEAVLDGFSEPDRGLFPDEIFVDPTTNSETLTVRVEVSTDSTGSISINRTAPAGGTGRQISRDQITGLGWKMVGASARSRDLRDERDATVADILHAIDLGEEKATFANLAEQVQATLSGSNTLADVRNRLAAQLSRALPQPVGTDELAFVSGANAEDDPLSDVRLQVQRNGTTRNLTEQSDGMRALFAIAMYDLVSESANIVAIDEPEIHLHPTSQRSLAGLLQSSGNQKIIATHSPDIVGAFLPEHIVTVKMGGRLVQPKAGFLSDDDRMVLRWWVRDKLEPLTASRVVGVEGISDRILLEAAAEVTGRGLDRLGVSVVETGGSGDMRSILKLFGKNGFDIDMSRLIDLDAAEGAAHNLGVAITDLNANSVWISDPDLEAEYVAALGADIVWDALKASGRFSSNELLNCEPTGPAETRTEADVAAFCRLKSTYKVRAAMVVASFLTPASARNIASIESLLREIDAATS
ncbi:MAG TPA: AAA family ATPase [Acidothermaceae bacterium]|nr:AAA family ATPase [Acidothermaceae bacterium]